MVHEKVELEFVCFTGSNMGANIQGYNPDVQLFIFGNFPFKNLFTTENYQK